MDFREGYKNSADSLSPDKQTVERMKTAVHAKLNEPKKAFPFKRIAYIGGTVAACLVIGVIGITALTGRDTASITEAAQNDTNSSYAISADTDGAAEEMAAESAAATTTAPATTTAIDLDAPKMYDEFPEDAVAENFDVAEEPLIDSADEDYEIMDENETAVPDEPFTDNVNPETWINIETESAAPLPEPIPQPEAELVSPVPDDIPEPEPPAPEPERDPPPPTPEPDAEQIVLYNQMENCSINGTEYARTSEYDTEADYTIVEKMTTPEGEDCEIYRSYTTDCIMVHWKGQFIGYYVPAEFALPVTITFSEDMTVCNIEGREYRRFSTEPVDADFDMEPCEPHYDENGTYYEIYYFGYALIFCNGEQIGQYERV